MSWISDIGMIIFYAWTAICLFIALLFLWQVGMHSDEFILTILLFCVIYFFPLWFPVHYVREYITLRKIGIVMEKIRNKKVV